MGGSVYSISLTKTKTSHKHCIIYYILFFWISKLSQATPAKYTLVRRKAIRVCCLLLINPIELLLLALLFIFSNNKNRNTRLVNNKLFLSNLQLRRLNSAIYQTNLYVFSINTNFQLSPFNNKNIHRLPPIINAIAMLRTKC